MRPGTRSAATGQPDPVVRLATYNVEWFNSLFDADGRLLDDDGPSGRFGVTRGAQLAALGTVFRALDPDAVMVIEAPDQGRGRSSVSALQAFAGHHRLRCREALMGFANGSQQEIALLYDPDALHAVHAPVGVAIGHPGALDQPRFDGVFRLDLDLDGTPEDIGFSKPPLEVAVQTRAGDRLRLIGVHVKSKAPHGARTPAQELRLAVENRRKQLAQCIWLRHRVMGHLAAGEALVVLGDFNDGPGLDEYEKLFGRSGLEIVLGWDEPHDVRLFDPHARLALGSKLGASPVSARFFLAEEGRFFSALLDYIMVSPDLRARGPKWRIWHPFDDPACFADMALRDALLMASDHFPVSIDLPA